MTMHGRAPGRAYRFRIFCSRMLGTGREAPLREVNGAAITALVDAFRECYPTPKRERLQELPDFSAEVYKAKWTCYAIKNLVTGETYVGQAKNGFINRYKDGAWWQYTLSGLRRVDPAELTMTTETGRRHI